MGNTFKTAALLGLLSGLLLFIGGQQGLLIAFIFALAMNFGSYWFSDKIVLKMYKAQEVGLEQPLHQMVERLSRRAGLPTPKVYVIPTEAPNAFATGRNPEHAAVTRQPLFCAVPVRGGFPARGQKKGGAGETPAPPPLKRSGYCMRCTTTLATGSFQP